MATFPALLMLTYIKTAETQRRVRRLRVAGWGASLLAVLVLAFTSFTIYSNWSAARMDSARAQSNRVYLRTLNSVLSLLDDAESAQRGYLLTDKDRYLEPYFHALNPLAQNLRALAAGAKDRPDQAERVERIQALVKIKLDELSRTIELHKNKRHDEAMTTMLTDTGLATMNALRGVAKTVLEEQRNDVAQRSADSERREFRAIEIGAAGSILIICLMAAGTLAWTSSVTQQARLTERLVDSEEVFETTLTSIGDGVIATDLTGRITFINPEAARLTGWNRQDAVGANLDEVIKLMHESTREKAESPFKKVVETGNIVGLANHTLLIRRDGVEVPIDDSGAPIRDFRGITSGVVLVFRGIEERRRVEASLKASHDELLKANEELRQFSYAATHDLQEPLRTIVVFSQLLGRNYRDTLDERARHLLQTVEDAGHRMSTLIEDLLAFTRIESSDSSTLRTTVSATAVLQDTLVQLNGAIAETNAVVQTTALPDVWSEAPKLSQIFQNLISNSIKYRKPDAAPVIRVSATVQDDFATFEIADNGIGFKQEYADRIFLLFQRLHGRSIPGTGIGLALCRRIVERQGGKIWAKSAENEGSSFFFTLPLAREEARL